MIEQLQLLSNQILAQKVPEYKRFLFDEIDFDERLIGILGSRGVGKTTLLLQYLHSIFKEKKTLYIMAEHPMVLELGLFSIADEFQKRGGEVLIIDEIHKIKSFEIDLKLIYDSFFSLNVVFTGSNAVAIDNAKADLSRRAVVYKLPVLSFREFLELETDEKFETISLEEILKNHTAYAIDILSKLKPFAYFNEYLKGGAYPFYKSSKNSYVQKLLSASMQILETDLPMIYAIEHDKINSLKKMMVMLCQSEPYDINISKLSGALELNQRTLYKYLGILQSAGLIRILGAKSTGVSIISKPEKIYLDNTNLFSIFCNNSKVGTIRETFFASSLSYKHNINYPKSGDFIVDEKYTFEIGGKNKSFKQLKDSKYGYIVADDIEVGADSKIPLWLFGFVY
ncbi:MAG: AAA family ATPase [Sulfurimonadaceae bacterium]|jgi:predicted AAA+ superfamily ATPase|nr:AAA family ATPase [Sulfurimonadaceae bacterium]